VAALVAEILKNWPGRWRRFTEKQPLHEAGRLQLANHKALQKLGWKPRLEFEQAISMSMDWYRESLQPGFDAFQTCADQIQDYHHRGSQGA